MKRIILALLALALLLCSCQKAEQEQKLDIVATMFPQYDFAREICGDMANIELLLDLGADAHSFDPTPADMIKIASADLFIYNGDEMEIWAAALLESADIKEAISHGSLTVLDLSKQVDLLEMHQEHQHTHREEYDSHIWTSPSNAKKMCQAIFSEVSRLDKSNENAYKSRLDGYLAELLLLEGELSAVGENSRLKKAFFGGSFAFAYMFHEANLLHSSVFSGCASHAEASASDIIEISNEIKETGASFVLYDSPTERKIADAIAAECGIAVLRLHAIHNITAEEFKSGESYLSLMKSNIETLGKALN